jgi:multimeric flavodoxin WrbA|tara:strand:- start:18 stop:518 length:501 start_codon:yes stop_codon:yes gene_type:complete
MNVAVIIGTSKSDGNTRKLVNSFVEKSGASIFDLSLFEISFFDYSHQNKTDDFLPLIRQLISFEHIVFATPIYWYSMSAQLKVFFDRFSDLLTIEKDLGRKLKGKSISVLSTGFDLDYPECFIQPFEMTATYLQLYFTGCHYVSIQSEVDSVNIIKTAESAAACVT